SCRAWAGRTRPSAGGIPRPARVPRWPPTPRRPVRPVASTCRSPARCAPRSASAAMNSRPRTAGSWPSTTVAAHIPRRWWKPRRSRPIRPRFTTTSQSTSSRSTTRASSAIADPFGTAEIRRRVLDAWAASPARFREDANAEEDYALGGYRDRLIVELAQNAADAAARAGVAGGLRLTLGAGMLVAANVGAPLDAAGVAALSTLRASG